MKPVPFPILLGFHLLIIAFNIYSVSLGFDISSLPTSLIHNENPQIQTSVVSEKLANTILQKV